ncbi:MAG: cation-translocating P-type ATPase [Simkaniaceae bacterium]
MRNTAGPYIFDEFFSSGKEESISPFLTPKSRKWAKNLALKTSIASALLLLFAFVSSFYISELSNILLLSVYFLVGTPALIETLEDIKNVEINIDVLMTLAAFLAILIGSQMEGALLLVLFALSGAMEEAVTQKTKGAIHDLKEISPSRANVLENGRAVQKSIHEVAVGSEVLIKAGEVIPLDGKVLEGASYVNMVHLTGESIPVAKKPGDEVQAGSQNQDGTLTIQVTKTSRDSTLARIIQLIQGAAEAKPKVEKLFDKFGKIYATSIIALAALFAAAFPFLFAMPFLGEEGALYRSLAFLIAASPCALIIATPTAYLSAISSCARKGILLKGGIVLDALAKSRIIAFDKTGTLTVGKLSFTHLDVYSFDNNRLSESDVIRIAATLERSILHPIAEAIENIAHQRGLRALEMKEFKARPGLGLEGIVNLHGEEKKAFIGSLEFMFSILGEKTLLEKWPDIREEATKKGQLLAFLLIDRTIYLFHFNDSLRPNMHEVITRLKNRFRLRIAMLTGDHQYSASKIAREAGIEEFYANLKPDDKLHLVSKFIEEGGLAMVGDGINDAPSLMRANVGISMGRIGSSAAIEASDVVFLRDELSLIEWLMDKAKKTKHILIQNISLALMVIVFATTPALLGLVPLWLAVILHEGGTVVVGLNSLRLLK